MASSWHRAEIGNHIDLLTGFPFSSEHYTEEPQDLRLLRGDNVVQGTIRWEGVKRWPASKSPDLERYQLAENDIVIAMDRTWVKAGLKIAQIKKEDTPSLLVQRVARLRAKGELDQNYLAQCITSYRFEQFVKGNQTETAVPHISSQQICDFTIPIPRIEEQQRIAAILRTWDEVIDKTRLLFEKRNAEYTAVSRCLFAPCHPTFKRRDSGWGPFTFGKLFKERAEPDTESEALLSITMADGVISQEEVGRRDSSCEDKSKYKLILPGDIGYNTMRMWQGVCGLSALRGIISPAYTVVTPIESKINARYAFHLFKSRRMIHDFERYSQGLTSDTWNLKYPAFSEIKVFIPELKIQIAQANYLDALNEEIAVLKRQVEALSRQKRGLMQKLLTGEWRVNSKSHD